MTVQIWNVDSRTGRQGLRVGRPLVVVAFLITSALLDGSMVYATDVVEPGRGRRAQFEFGSPFLSSTTTCMGNAPLCCRFRNVVHVHMGFLHVVKKDGANRRILESEEESPLRRRSRPHKHCLSTSHLSCQGATPPPTQVNIKPPIKELAKTGCITKNTFLVVK